MSDLLEDLLAEMRAEPHQAEHWVRLYLHALAERDSGLLIEIHKMREQVFGDAGLLLFQSCYSNFVQDDPDLQSALPSLADQMPIQSEAGLVLYFFAGCQEICTGMLDAGLQRWNAITRHLDSHGQKLRQIPQLTELPTFIRLFSPASESDEAALPGIKWLSNPPAPSATGPVFLAACDGSYFERFGPRFIELISGHGPIHLHIADPSPVLTLQLEEMTRPGLSFTIEESGDWRAASYYASMRFLHAREIQEELQQDLIILDVDLEEVRHLETLLAKCAENDAACFDSGLLLPWLKYQAAFLYLRWNDNGKCFLDLLTRHLTSHLQNPTWFLDQTCSFIGVAGNGIQTSGHSGKAAQISGWHSFRGSFFIER